MMDLSSWFQAAVLSPSQCPDHFPLLGKVERVTTIPRSPVTLRKALGGETNGVRTRNNSKKSYS